VRIRESLKTAARPKAADARPSLRRARLKGQDILPPQGLLRLMPSNRLQSNPNPFKATKKRGMLSQKKMALSAIGDGIPRSVTMCLAVKTNTSPTQPPMAETHPLLGLRIARPPDM